MTELHIVSCEYPPQIGGVSSYVATVAAHLGAADCTVHVWCPAGGASGPEPLGVTVHADLGEFGPKDLRRAGELLDRFPAPRRLLIQWVPHGYGYRSMNLPFCLWVHGRARKGDQVELMVHEPYLSFDGSWRQMGAAAVHRTMTLVLLNAARRVWISTPAWRSKLQPYAAGRALGFDWLPVPSPVHSHDDPTAVAELRARYALDGPLVGHFGMYSRLIAPAMASVARQLLDRTTARILLIGDGSERLRRDVLLGTGADAQLRVHAAGTLSEPDLVSHLLACDLLVQPYPDGVTSRRTSVMASLSLSKPIVTTTGPSTEAIWREQGGVCLVPAGDAPAIVRAIERLLTEPEARQELSARARALYDGQFHVKHTVNALLATDLTDPTEDTEEHRRTQKNTEERCVSR